MKYDFNLEIESDNNSLSKIIKRISPKSVVLEFGCANGRLTKYLHKVLSCNVTIVELDEEAGKEAMPYASKSLLGEHDGDIEKYNWCKEIDNEQYDYIVLADVLEHLIDPETALLRMKPFLKPNGSIIVSIPNIANNAVIANLIRDEFIYTNIGLLDRTHISFYTVKTFERLVKKIGMFMSYESATYLNIENNEVDISYKDISTELQKVLLKRKFGDVYQNIFEFSAIDKGDPLLDYEDTYFLYFSSSVMFRYSGEENLDTLHAIQQNINTEGNISIQKKFEKPIDLIRLDPMETNGIVKYNEIIINGKPIDITTITHNADAVCENYFFFSNDDPYLYIMVDNVDSLGMQICYSIVDFDLDKADYKLHINEFLKKQIDKINYQNGQIVEQQSLNQNLQKTVNLKENQIIGLNDNIYNLNLDIEKMGETLKHKDNNLRYYAELADRNSKEISDLNEKYTISEQRLNSIKKRSTIFWKLLDKYNPLRYSREIDYFVDSVHVSLAHIKIKGWVISTKGETVAIKGRPSLKVIKRARLDVNRLRELEDTYDSGFEVSACPFLPLKLKFIEGNEVNIYKINGTKLYLKYFKEVYKKVKKSVKKRGFKRTLLLSYYMAIGKKHLYADSYDQWFALHKASDEELQSQRNHEFEYNPLISIIVPTYNTPVHFLEEMVFSIENQTYSNWELCIADGCSSNKKTIQRLKELEKQSNKIHIKFLPENFMISGNSNEAIKMVSGEFVALMDHDDTIELNALYEFVKMLNENPNLDFIYSDEDKMSENGKHHMVPHFKPDFSIDNLRNFNYITHFVLIRKTILDKVGLFDSKCDGAQDYDLFLRIVDETKNIGHVSKILYHWRVSSKSTARDISTKSYVMDAGKYALSKHLERNHLNGVIKDGLEPTLYKVDYEIIGNPLISIVIATKDFKDDLDKCIMSILNKSTYKNYEIIVVENNSTEAETFAYYKTLEAYENIHVIYWEHEFNYSQINNFGVNHTNGDYIVLLNNDIEVITSNWLEEMLMFAQREDVGAVGAKLLYPDDTIQHAGVIVGLGGVAAHSHRLYPRDNVGYVGRLIISQNLSAVTAACLMIKKSKFLEVGGLTEKYKVAFNDVDFCLKVREKGYLNVMTPFAQLYHYESKSRGYEDTFEKQQRFLGEQLMFKEDWKDILKNGDPFYNPNLTLSAEDFSLKQL